MQELGAARGRDLLPIRSPQIGKHSRAVSGGDGDKKPLHHPRRILAGERLATGRRRQDWQQHAEQKPKPSHARSKPCGTCKHKTRGNSRPRLTLWGAQGAAALADGWAADGWVADGFGELVEGVGEGLRAGAAVGGGV